MSVQVRIENRKNTGGSAAEPANFTAQVNPGTSSTFKALLPNAPEKILATHITLDNPSYKLTVKPADGANANSPLEVKGNGTGVPTSGGEKIDIAKWTVQANKV
jgi:hypothetical protein